MIAMKLNGRVMKGASSLPIEFRSALETNTLKNQSIEQNQIQTYKLNSEHPNIFKPFYLTYFYLANAPRHTATQRWISLSETRWKRAGRTVPRREPLKELTPQSTMEEGCRPSRWSVKVAMKPMKHNPFFLFHHFFILRISPPKAHPIPALVCPMKIETRIRRPQKGLFTNTVQNLKVHIK